MRLTCVIARPWYCPSPSQWACSGAGHQHDAHRRAIGMHALGQVHRAAERAAGQHVQAARDDPRTEAEAAERQGRLGRHLVDEPGQLAAGRAGAHRFHADVVQQAAADLGSKATRKSRSESAGRIAAVQHQAAIDGQPFALRVPRRDLVAVDVDHGRHRRVERQKALEITRLPRGGPASSHTA